MKLKRTVNFRFLFVALVFCFDVFLLLPILPESLIFLPTVIVICWILRFIFDYGIYYENSYLYLKRGRGKISHQKDNAAFSIIENCYNKNKIENLSGLVNRLHYLAHSSNRKLTVKIGSHSSYSSQCQVQGKFLLLPHYHRSCQKQRT